jgi:glyoxylase-like metal-dependent hydrolase (beta-lactamase superfamily II)
MFRFAVALLMTAAQVPNPEEMASVVLLIDQTNEGVIYVCNGRQLDEKQILRVVEEELEARHPNASAIELGKKPVFVLVESSLPLDALYEVGSPTRRKGRIRASEILRIFPTGQHEDHAGNLVELAALETVIRWTSREEPLVTIGDHREKRS